MTKTFIGEIWKEAQFDFEYVNKLRVEVSNFGRVRSFSKLTNGEILRGSLINGYQIVRFKLFKAHNVKTVEILTEYRKQIVTLNKKINLLKTEMKVEAMENQHYRNMSNEVELATKELEKVRAVYQKKYRAAELKRAINHGLLVHRMVAEYFLEKPSKDHTIVGHLDYDKLNNQARNLKWMTKEENMLHQSHSPYVIEARKNQLSIKNHGGKAYKLTLASVMLIKKKIEQGVALRIIAKSFKVSETQLLRIKRGENWKSVEAAP